MVWNDTSSLYTPRCKDFNAAFKGMPGITTHATEISREDGTFADFDGAVYINHREWVAITATDGKLIGFSQALISFRQSLQMLLSVP